MSGGFPWRLPGGYTQLTGTFPDQERHTLARQMPRAALGVPSNLAEGAARQSSKEFRHFLSIARGSLSELDTQLDLSMQLGLVPDSVRRGIDPILIRVDQMLYALIGKKKRAIA